MTPAVLGLVADDLTGAADAAAGFAEQGWRVLLVLSPDASGVDVVAELGDDDPGTGVVLAVSTGVRAATDEEAESLTNDAVQAVRGAGAERLYLKIDSTVRGSIAGQLAGALAGWSGPERPARAVICPAFPSERRTVEDAQVLVAGTPVGQTAAASDPVTPRTVSDLAQLLPGARRANLPDLGAGGDRLIIDATDDEDLDRLSAAAITAGPDLIMVGSAGLAAALGRAWGTRRRPTRPSIDGPVLTAVSSLHPVTAQQLRRLADRHSADLVDVLITSRRPTTAAEAAANLATAVREALDQTTYGALLLVGGDGAAAVLARLDAQALLVDGTVVPGCPTGIIRGGAADRLRFVTKSGGFGDPDTLSTIVRRLRAPDSPPPSVFNPADDRPNSKEIS